MRLSNWLTGFFTGMMVGYWYRGRRMAAPGVILPVRAPPALPPLAYFRPPDSRDAVRADFLLYLATARLPITAWEAQFLRGTLGRAWFTEKQRAVIDRLRLMYESQL